MRGTVIPSFVGSPIGAAIFVTIAISFAAWIWARATAEALPQSGGARFRTLPLMILVATVCSSLFLVFYALAFNASEFVPVAEPAQPSPSTAQPSPSTAQPSSGTSLGMRVPAITIAAGLFGGVLFIAFTVLKYRSHLQADEKLAIEHRTAMLQTAEHFSERFAQAAELLGSERSATRMGGVYALAALADEWVENRQQCIDLLCGYLRTPVRWTTSQRPGEAVGDSVDIPPPPPTPRQMLPRPKNMNHVEPSTVEAYRKRRGDIADTYVASAAPDEIAVRKAVVSTIARGTRRAVEGEASWSNMTFDLSRCYLEDLDFSECRFMQKVDFNGTIFGGSTNMRGVYFGNNAQFDGCLFKGRTWFSGATFAGHAWFRAAEFCKEAAFGRAVFLSGMLFSFAHFAELPYLRANRLGRPKAEELTDIPIANWDGVSFGGDMTACPDQGTPDVWSYFHYVQPGYSIICEKTHPDSPLGLEPNSHSA